MEIARIAVYSINLCDMKVTNTLLQIAIMYDVTHGSISPETNPDMALVVNQ